MQRSFPFANRTLNFTNGHSLCMGRNIYMGEFTDELLGYGCVHRTKIVDIDGDLRIQEVPRCYQLLSGHAATCHCLCNKIRGESSPALISLRSVRPGSRRPETREKTQTPFASGNTQGRLGHTLRSFNVRRRKGSESGTVFPSGHGGRTNSHTSTAGEEMVGNGTPTSGFGSWRLLTMGSSTPVRLRSTPHPLLHRAAFRP